MRAKARGYYRTAKNGGASSHPRVNETPRVRFFFEQEQFVRLLAVSCQAANAPSMTYVWSRQEANGSGMCSTPGSACLRHAFHARKRMPQARVPRQEANVPGTCSAPGRKCPRHVFHARKRVLQACVPRQEANAPGMCSTPGSKCLRHVVHARKRMP